MSQTYKKLYLLVPFFLIFSLKFNAEGYNTLGQVGLINIPTALLKEEQSSYITFSKNSYSKFGALTVTPFKWLEASFFYNRPDDLIWGSTPGLYLDKGFNVKFSYAPKNYFLPKIAIGLDDFAETGQLSKEYLVATYKLKNIDITSGIGWGKFTSVSSNNFKNPFSYLKESFDKRQISSDSGLGGSPAYGSWFRGDATIFGGIEYYLPVNGLSLKVETDPYSYFDFMCCGEGQTSQSFDFRKKDSDINFGINYQFKDFGNFNFSYVKGNTWKFSFSIGFSSKKPFVKKKNFEPSIINTNYNQENKKEFYYDLLQNLNQNLLYLQTAELEEKELSITIDSETHINPIKYSYEAAFISKKVGAFNEIELDEINISHITRGIQINQVSYLSENIGNDYKPIVLIKRETRITNPKYDIYNDHEFQPKPVFPLINNEISPDIRTHLGSPERVMYVGYGIKANTEIQLSRNLVIYSTINQPIDGNFDKKTSLPSSALEHVRTEIVDYLQNTSNRTYITNLNIERIWSPKEDFYTRISFGLLETMYGGITSEMLYKPFNSRFAFGFEFNSIKQRDYDQRFSFKDYKTNTSHFNLSFYEPKSNILLNLSFGKYLAGDKGYTLDVSRRMPSGWRAGFFFTRTDVSAELFGEGSFDKGFYINIPHNIFSKNYSKSSTGFAYRPMTRDGGQKLNLQNRLIDSFYGSTKIEIDENWN